MWRDKTVHVLEIRLAQPQRAAVQPADDFPVDDSCYGFDNIGDALSMPPVLVEKYLAAAQRILDAALVPPRHGPPQVKRFPVDPLEVGYNAKQRGDGCATLWDTR